MEIFNRPPVISQDTLKYIIYPGPSFQERSSVIALAAVVDTHVSSVLPNHIWHRDAFELKVVSTSHDPNKWILEGCMRVGDCVDDEWCVVWLLIDISKRWDVTVSVVDSDGEFLLIEAADYLPAWVTPTNSENRVWIHGGRLHLVPLQHVSTSNTKRERRRIFERAESDDEGVGDPTNEDDYISMFDAIQVVRNPDVDSLAPPNVEHAAMRKTKDYPELARQHLHRTKAYLPRDIVIALSNNPALVQRATEAFYTRDSSQLRAAARMGRFPPGSSVLSTVTMTRAAYAQLVGQRFHPPRVFGKWKEPEGSPQWRWRDVGMKIACGFEMLYQESKSREEVVMNPMDGTDALIDAQKDALRRDHEYIAYIHGLQGIGYFGEETQGSAAWKEQENRAATQFINSKIIDNANRPSFASLLNLAISEGEGRVSQLVNGGEDSEEWLVVDESTVDRVLANSVGTSAREENDNMLLELKIKKEVSHDDMETEQAAQLQNFAEKVQKFVEGKGDVEGAMFEDDLLSDDDVSNLTDSDDESASGSQEYKLSVPACDADRQAAMDRLVPAIEPSEYGKMPPAFHSNSQKVKAVAVDAETPLDGASSKRGRDTDSQPIPTRPLIFPRDQFDGVEDSDDESGGSAGGDSEEDEDQPTFVGEVEVDLQQELEEFLEFSREELGVTQSMWNTIIQDRKERGAFLPASALHESENTPVTSLEASKVSAECSHTIPNLDSFEAVMQAMDAELSRAKRGEHPASTKTVPTKLPSKQRETKGKQKTEDEDEDMDTAMDTELREALQDTSDEDSLEDAEASIDYSLIKNFLESFKSQHGLPGPVSNMAGRLQPGWKLPRDEI